MIIPTSLVIGKIVGNVLLNIGQSVISDKIKKYVENNFDSFEKKYEKASDKDKIILLQQEIIKFKDFQVTILEKIVEEKDEKKRLKYLDEFHKSTEFVKKLEYTLIENEVKNNDYKNIKL